MRDSLVLTAIIYDTLPIQAANEPPTHRTVHVRLTPEQCTALSLRSTHEAFGLTYIEPAENAAEAA